MEPLKFDMNKYISKRSKSLTAIALERCKGKYLVGYTDIHPGLDCVAAWRDPQQLCFDMIDSPEEVKHLAELIHRRFRDRSIIILITF